MWCTLFLFGVLAVRGSKCQSPGGVPVPAVGSEYYDRGPDNSYRFGFQTGDKGGHYHAAIASKENQVAGRFGSRDPASGRVQETQYTAGQRGFRARGPNIARRMDLSQSKIPYNPPVSPNSPNYNPTYDGYHDPNEDPTYNFAFNTPTHVRKENSDARGHVDGAYTYVDDVGERHDVRYEAGARIGFNVKTPFPDSKTFSGLFYRGPTKPGGLPRGKTSIQQSGDGSYRFVSAGPDQRRAEVSDSKGNVRGSYTYLDDKGLQRTVEYIAGPNIGYKVINKGIGPNFPPIPPFIPPQNLFPNFPSKFEELNPNNIVPPQGGSGSGGGSFDGLFGEDGSKGPSTPFSPTERPFGSTSSSGGSGSSGPPDFLDGLDPFSTQGSTTKPPSFQGQGFRPGSQGGGGPPGGDSGFLGPPESSDEDFLSGPGPQGGSGFPGSGPPGSSGFGEGPGSQGSSGFGNRPRPSGGSRPPGGSGFGGSSRPSGGSGFPGGSRPPGGSGFPGGSGPPGGSGFGGGSRPPGGSGFGGGTGPQGGSGFGGDSGPSGGSGFLEGPGPQGGDSSEGQGFTGPGGKPDSDSFTTVGTTSGSSGGFEGYPSGRPQGAGGLFPGDLPNNCCNENEGVFTTLSPVSSSSDPTTSASSQSPFGQTSSGFEDDLFPPLSAFPEDDPTVKKPRPPLAPASGSSGNDGGDFLGGPFADLPPPPPSKFGNNFNKNRPRPDPEQSRPQQDDDNSFLSSNKNFIGFPPGVSVKGRIQSLDIPYGSRIPPPGLALDRHITHNKKR